MLALVWLGAAVPLMNLYDERADLLERCVVMARRMAQVAAGLSALQAQQSQDAVSAKPAASVPPVRALLTGGSDAIAGAALQGLLQPSDEISF